MVDGAAFVLSLGGWGCFSAQFGWMGLVQCSIMVDGAAFVLSSGGWLMELELGLPDRAVHVDPC